MFLSDIVPLAEMAGFTPVLLQGGIEQRASPIEGDSGLQGFCSIQGFLLLQTNLLCPLFHLLLPGLFGRPRFFLPLTSKSRPALRTLSSSLLSTCPYHLTLFAVANRPVISFNSNMSIYSSFVFLSTIFRPHMALTIALFVFLKTAFSFSFKHHASLPYSIADLMQQQ